MCLTAKMLQGNTQKAVILNMSYHFLGVMKIKLRTAEMQSTAIRKFSVKRVSFLTFSVHI